MADFVLDKSHKDYREHWEQLMFALSSAKTPVIVHVKKKSDKRSNNFNRYYWGVVLPYISEDTGMDEYSLHCIFKARYLPSILSDDQIAFGLSTADLSHEQMAKYVDKIIEFALSFLEIVIPQPNAVHR